MPASDHINRQLFHGSNASFEVGDVVSPKYDVYGEGEAHSTNDPMYASTFGDYVYEVEPLSNPRLVQSEDDKEHWVSNTGYKVTRQVY
jgi:hypothetical protein